MENPLILIIIDALGYELAEKYRFSIKGLPVKRRLRTVPGFSQSALTSIFTGCRPDEHGLWMMYSFARDDSPLGWLSFFPSGVTTRRRWLRRLIDWKLKRIDGIKSYYSLYSVPKEVLQFLSLKAQNSIFLPGGGGRRRTIIDEFCTREARIFIRDYRTPESESFTDLREYLKDRRCDFYMLYTAGLDSSLHRYGTSHREVESHLEWYSRRIEEVASAAGDCDIVVMGDHGMCDVYDSIDMIKCVEKLDLKIPADYIPFYDSTMARFKVFTERAEERIGNLLSGIEIGNTVTRDQKNELGIDFGDNVYGDIIFILDQGYIINPSYMGDKMIKGMHGYRPDSSCMYSGLFTNMESAADIESITGVAGVLLPGFSSQKGVPDGNC